MLLESYHYLEHFGKQHILLQRSCESDCWDSLLPAKENLTAEMKRLFLRNCTIFYQRCKDKQKPSLWSVEIRTRKFILNYSKKIFVSNKILDKRRAFYKVSQICLFLRQCKSQNGQSLIFHSDKLNFSEVSMIVDWIFILSSKRRRFWNMLMNLNSDFNEYSIELKKNLQRFWEEEKIMNNCSLICLNTYYAFQKESWLLSSKILSLFLAIIFLLDDFEDGLQMLFD